MRVAISSKRESLAEFSRRFHIRRLEVFGSAARGFDFDALRSDTDFLVEFASGVRPTSDLLLDFEDALQHLPGRPIDLIQPHVIEARPDYLRRRQILREAEPVHVAG